MLSSDVLCLTVTGLFFWCVGVCCDANGSRRENAPEESRRQTSEDVASESSMFTVVTGHPVLPSDTPAIRTAIVQGELVDPVPPNTTDRIVV